MKAVVFAIPFAIVIGGVAHADFQMDRSALEIRTALKKPAVIDLSVGEVGMKQRLFFCTKNDKLFIVSDVILDSSESSYGPTYRIKRLPGDIVSLTVTMGKTLAGETLNGDIADTLNSATSTKCDGSLFSERPTLQVQDINGKTKVSDFLPK